MNGSSFGIRNNKLLQKSLRGTRAPNRESVTNPPGLPIQQQVEHKKVRKKGVQVENTGFLRFQFERKKPNMAKIHGQLQICELFFGSIPNVILLGVVGSQDQTSIITCFKLVKKWKTLIFSPRSSIFPVHNTGNKLIHWTKLC